MADDVPCHGLGGCIVVYVDYCRWENFFVVVAKTKILFAKFILQCMRNDEHKYGEFSSRKSKYACGNNFQGSRVKK